MWQLLQWQEQQAQQKQKSEEEADAREVAEAFSITKQWNIENNCYNTYIVSYTP